ncbi:aspartate kinase [Bacillaceae bacterium Marseille-Q3522]|nr:aspartate kinase [Bacillaceae bacterium Marseille-Q3522]
MKVVKFGGSSLASASQIKKVRDIVAADAARKIVVVSAPGKRYPDDEKVTDLLIACGKAVLGNEDYSVYLKKVLQRFADIANDLSLTLSVITDIEDDLLARVNKDKSNQDEFMEEIKAGGEDNNAKLIAAYFQTQGMKAQYVNPKVAGLLVSDEPGNAQVLPQAYEKLSALREYEGIIVFPGFFGYTEQGKVATFSRSGSDITGSILANGIKAEIYENFTDVDAVYAANPMVVSDPKEIRELTYREMRELSYAGFSVFHDEALIPAFRAGIPVQIKNTNNPATTGTRIVHQRKNSNGPVVGIAHDEGFCSIYISKYLMNREIGFGRKVLQILEEAHLSYEHIPSGIDDISIILRQDQLKALDEAELLARLKEKLHADEVKIQHDLALVMIVGEGMRQNVGTTARAAGALAGANVNIEMINQGSSEVSMMFGVKEMDEIRAVQALYHEFFVKSKVNV